MNNALVGFTGFVGSTLLKQATFEALFRSTNIDDIEGKAFDMVVCAGAPAQKWIANRDPETDRRTIDSLIEKLKTVRCETFVLISTVDVFKSPVGVDENTVVAEEGLHAYGLHRRLLEKFVASHFSHHLIIRLPGLIGPGLRKNVLFDLLNDNNLAAIDGRAVFQFYPMVNLWQDIKVALDNDLRLVHLTAAPVSVAELSLKGFGNTFDRANAGVPARYDCRSRHALVFGGAGGYQYSARETIQAVRAYAQSEPRAPKQAAGANP